MATKRYNRISFDRNIDNITKRYRVFRSTGADVTVSSTCVMEIEDPGKPNPIFVQGEALKQITTLQFKARHRRMFPSDAATPYVVYINGVEAQTAGYAHTVNLETGIVKFYKLLPSDAIITMDYYFDGIQVTDWGQEQDGVTYYGPPAQDDSTPNAPANPSIVGDPNNDRVILKWGPGGMTGETFYYGIQAIDDEGNFSQLSKIASTFLYEGYAIRGYTIERSYDGVLWEIIAQTDDTQFSDFGVDKVSPNPPTALASNSSFNVDHTTSNVTLNWVNPMTDPSSPSPQYRIRVISATGNWSPPTSILGPIYLANVAKQIVIRRKPYDGTAISFSGEDAETIFTTTDITSQTYVDTVPDSSDWSYAVYRVDAGGNPSIAASKRITIGSASV